MDRIGHCVVLFFIESDVISVVTTSYPTSTIILDSYGLNDAERLDFEFYAVKCCTRNIVVFIVLPTCFTADSADSVTIEMNLHFEWVDGNHTF